MVDRKLSLIPALLVSCSFAGLCTAIANNISACYLLASPKGSCAAHSDYGAKVVGMAFGQSISTKTAQ